VIAHLAIAICVGGLFAITARGIPPGDIQGKETHVVPHLWAWCLGMGAIIGAGVFIAVSQ
jgi:hypothetical protein